MRSIVLSTILATISTKAFAHGGHVADIGDGHSHFEGVIALAAVGIITTLILKKRFFS